VIWWPSIKISTTTFFSNKISVQLLLISNCLEERIEDLCKLSFFLHPIQKNTRRFWFPYDCCNPKRLGNLFGSLKKQTTFSTIYFWQLNNLNWINYYSLWSLFFLFLVFFLIYYYLSTIIFWFFPLNIYISLSTLNQ